MEDSESLLVVLTFGLLEPRTVWKSPGTNPFRRQASGRMKSLLPQQQVHVRRWVVLGWNFNADAVWKAWHMVWIMTACTAANYFSALSEAQFEPSCAYLQFYSTYERVATICSL